jgi:hypothetical protein
VFEEVDEIIHEFSARFRTFSFSTLKAEPYDGKAFTRFVFDTGASQLEVSEQKSGYEAFVVRANFDPDVAGDQVAVNRPT